MMTTIFVYGTLKRGMPNHSYLGGAKFLGVGFAPGALYKDGWLPIAVKPVSGEESRISGEIYEVSDERLRLIDGLEGHPGWYQRELVEIKMCFNPQWHQQQADKLYVFVDAWIYYQPTAPDGAVRVVSGVY